jgi:[acyl-carrier-protein] S-malonyltransferase
MIEKKIAVLFSGQGAQEVGMGLDLSKMYDEMSRKFAEADKQLGFSLSELAFEGPIGELTSTKICQPALYVHGLALLDILKKELPDFQFEAAAGLSLGEFTAHAAAETFSFKDGLNLVSKRGQFMEEACRQTDGSMAAMIGGKPGDVIRLAEDCDVDVANLNAPGQIVLSGGRSQINQVLSEAREYGVRRATELQVAGAYHSRLMQPARHELEEVLQETAMTPPKCEVISNYRALPVSDPEEIRNTLAAQVTGSVRWAESMQLLINSGIELFIELGPGGILKGLMNRIDKNVQVLSISDKPTLDAALEQLRD